ncbi:hypothetical protein B0T26DRAFT_700356 [Lasiosphaeria miniovina]|uniref:Uncharacterized protein n=1 Tax=Lasiosphaeria miniovina TaxID=1954250 RepID=A0AA40ATN2_9PEZI|nr:uncharacterized protein B0T26DRAFT_700356 [Lasiosphaeria miniovina]KAK0721813.1 hypothetical protein B0T26DRAFT_700356 [Lasiosphaeria miniovina]
MLSPCLARGPVLSPTSLRPLASSKTVGPTPGSQAGSASSMIPRHLATTLRATRSVTSSPAPGNRR